MLEQILFALWFFLPAGIANVAPVFAAKAPVLAKWNTPIDFGAKFNGKPLLGTHKTVRGLLVGVLAGTLVFLAQTEMYGSFGWAREISGGLDYSELSIALGLLLSFGALFGDMVKSFAKRQIGVPAGKSWFPFDQTDYIFGGLLLSTIVVSLSLVDYIYILIVWFVMHLLSSYIGYRIKLKSDPI